VRRSALDDVAERVDGLLPSQECNRVAWWVTLMAFTLITVSVVGDYFTPWMDQLS
jgi:hypothetical protein